MRQLLLLAFALCSLSLRAQPGAYVGAMSMDAPYWGFLGQMNASFNGGFGGGVHYGIPLWQGNAILSPGLGYAHFMGATRWGNGRNEAHQLLVRGSFRFFPLEWLLPCECQVYKKGILAEGSAGWSRWSLSHQNTAARLEDVAHSGFYGFAGGFSIPFGNKMTFTPLFRYTIFPSVTWDGLNAVRDPQRDPYSREETFIRQMSFEIHFLFGS